MAFHLLHHCKVASKGVLVYKGVLVSLFPNSKFCLLFCELHCSHVVFAKWKTLHAFYRLLIYFSKSSFSKKKGRNTIGVSNSLDPDQARHFVGPDLGPNCLQRFSADDKEFTYCTCLLSLVF